MKERGRVELQHAHLTKQVKNPCVLKIAQEAVFIESGLLWLRLCKGFHSKLGFHTPVSHHFG